MSSVSVRNSLCAPRVCTALCSHGFAFGGFRAAGFRAFAGPLARGLPAPGLVTPPRALSMPPPFALAAAAFAFFPAARSQAGPLSTGHDMPRCVQHNRHEPTCCFLLRCCVRRRSQLVIVFVICEEVRASLRRKGSTCGSMCNGCQLLRARCRHDAMRGLPGGCHPFSCRQRPC